MSAEPAADRITLRLCGEPVIDVGGRIRALEPRAAALLALIAVEGEVAREHAATLLWADSTDPRAALRQQLARFRRLAGVALVDGADRLRLAPGIGADLSRRPDVLSAAPLLGELRFPDQPAFDGWLMRQRERTTAVPPVAPAAVSEPAAPLPPTLLRPPQLIGRAADVAALAQAWEAGRAVLLLGEAGLGKSRLLAEFAQSRRVLMVAGRPGDAGVPYATLARLLRLLVQRCAVAVDAALRQDLARLLPEMAAGATLPVTGQRLALQVAIERLLTAARLADGPVDGLIIDDLHVADDASLEMLQALVAAPSVPLRFAFAQRPGEGSAAAAALRDALEEGGLLTSTALSPLSQPELAALLDSLQIEHLDAARVAGALARHTGGNPLFALETIKHGVASGALRAGELPRPPSVGALIARRLSLLSPRALAIARVAAVAGPDFDIALAEAVLDERALDLADPWRALQSAQVFNDSAFAHDLVAQAVLDGVPAVIARELHGAVARWLQVRDGEPARIAQHWLDAGAQAEALRWLVEAAQRARRAGRMVEAGRFWQRAAAVCDQLDRSDEAFDMLYEATSTLADSLGLAVTESLAAELARRARTDRQRGRALMMQADVEYERGAPLAQTIVDGLACARAAGDRHTEAQLLFEEGKRLATSGDLGGARAVIAASLDLMESVGGHDYVADKLSSLATLDSMLGNLHAADAAYERSRALSLQHRIYEGQPMRLSSHALLKLELGDGDGARARLDEIDVLERSGWIAAGAGTYRRAVLKAGLLVRLLLGEPAAALRLYADRIHGSADADDAGVAALSAWLFDQLGRRDLMLRAMDTARRAGPRNVSLALLQILSLRDDPAAAAQLWHDNAAPGGFGDVLTQCLTVGYLAPHAPGQLGLDALQSLADRARDQGWHGYLGGLRAVQAELHARDGERELAARAAAQAEPRLGHVGMFYRPWGWLRCASAYRQIGNDAAARRCAQAGAQLTRTMVEALPTEYRSSFLDRHPVHRALLLQVDRRG
ncbi:MAG: AAA family ATPase [Burkholderiaceae bacterium]|jgi:tetratricopeptide (TPR) repeat protein|nr:AAA family ATPase [Burkholderiaceae bacterium]